LPRRCAYARFDVRRRDAQTVSGSLGWQMLLLCSVIKGIDRVSHEPCEINVHASDVSGMSSEGSLVASLEMILKKKALFDRDGVRTGQASVKRSISSMRSRWLTIRDDRCYSDWFD